MYAMNNIGVVIRECSTKNEVKSMGKSITSQENVSIVGYADGQPWE